MNAGKSSSDQHANGGATLDAVEPFRLSDTDDDETSDRRRAGEKKEGEEAFVSRPSSNGAWGSRPQSKPNLVERLENAADLDEFEQREREILQAIEQEEEELNRSRGKDDESVQVLNFNEPEAPYEHAADALEVINEEQEEPSVKEQPQSNRSDANIPDSVQNRELSANLRQDTSFDVVSDESDYPEGFPVPSTDTQPPPAYSINTEAAARKQVQIIEHRDEGNAAFESQQANGSLGSVVVQAGGLAAALATSARESELPNQHKPLARAKMSNDEDLLSRSSDDFNDFIGDNSTSYEQQQQSQTSATGSIPNPTYRLSNDIKELLHFVEDFVAERIEIQPILRPFILDYIPAVGDVDPFLKIPRPDQIDDQLGLVVLDEPAATQSDPTIVDMKLRQLSNVVSKQADAPVKKLDRADKNTDHIDNWIKNIKELRRSRPPDRVAYSRAMPDLEKLMQEWPVEMDALLQSIKVPTARLDCSVEEYADICLSLVDIPVHKNRIHALHLLFSLYAEFKNSQHFRNMASSNANVLYADAPPKTADRLEL